MSAPALRFNEFSENWKHIEIGVVGDIITGSTPDTSEDAFYDGQKIFVSPADMNSSRFISETKTTLTDAGFKQGRKVRANSVLFVCIGSTIGKVAQNKVECITNQQINSVVPNNNHSSNFIYSRLEKDALKIAMFAGKQAVPIINKTSFSKVEICVPELPEQTKIANFLTAVDEKITQLTQKHDLLTQYKKGVMQPIFSQELRFKDDDGQDFPDWKQSRLGDVTEVIMGQSPDSNSYNDFLEGKPLIQGNADISNRKTSPRAWTTEPTKECKVNDIILTVRAPVGAVAISHHDACVGRGVCAIRSNEGTVSNFVYQLLLWFEPTRWVSLEQGSTFTAVSSKDVKTIDMPFPSFKEQTKIANFLTVIDDKTTATQSQLQAVKQYKQGLLQQMFV